MSLASRLYILGLADQEVITFLAGYPGPSAVAFKRRPGNFESAVSWLWKYSCRKARSNRKLDPTDMQSTFSAAPPSSESTSVSRETPTIDRDSLLSEINSLDDFNKARDYMRTITSLAPLERTEALTRLKGMLKVIGVTGWAVDEEMRSIDTSERAQSPSGNGPVFPFMGDNGRVISHTDNFGAIMNHHGVTIEHNTMSHEFDIMIPNRNWLADTMMNDQYTSIQDLMERHNMTSTRAGAFISCIGGQNPKHPVVNMLKNTTWDGLDRIGPMLDTLKLTEDTPDGRFMRDKLVTTWLVSAIKVLGDYGTMPPRGVLVLAGPQSCGKTSFFRIITPPFTFGEGLHLDVRNKDSMKKSVKYWIVELGEIDTTFKKSEISALKAHISNTVDEMRLPYKATEDKWPRRTVYSGTVNRVDFLQDYSGNTRFWPVEVDSVDLDALTILMAGNGIAQFWKQVQNTLGAGHPYVLDAKEIRALEDHNESFREKRAEEETLLARFDWREPKTIAMTTGEIVAACGVGQLIKGHNPFVEPLQKLTGQRNSRSVRRGNGVARCWMMPPLQQLT